MATAIEKNQSPIVQNALGQVQQANAKGEAMGMQAVAQGQQSATAAAGKAMGMIEQGKKDKNEIDANAKKVGDQLKDSLTSLQASLNQTLNAAPSAGAAGAIGGAAKASIS